MTHRHLGHTTARTPKAGPAITAARNQTSS